MARGTTTALSEVIRATVRGGEASLNDRDLLVRFAATGDEGAFAALFRRHSGMVLGVCRRALSNVQDAEDACQATFLLLARRAKAGRWQPSIVNWLYTAARRVARNARRSAERRSHREKKAAVPEVMQPVDKMTGRELLDALDVELDKLPPAYREPLVLCYLEGLTRDEAAARLGMPAGTVKTRLERGRKRLGDALTRRGCVPGAGLLALAATSSAGASSPRLLQATLTAAAGSPSQTVAKLAEGVAINGIGKMKLLGLLALVGAGLAGIGLVAGRPNAAERPPEKSTPAETASPEHAKAADPNRAADRGKEVVLKGRVIGVDGKAFAGAKLCLFSGEEPAVDLGVSTADGQFAAAIHEGRGQMYLVARAEGYGIAFIDLRQTDRAAEVRLRLVSDHPIQGRVINTQGKPVAGVSVRIVQVGVYPNDSLDTFLVEWKKRHFMDGIPSGITAIGDAVGSLFPATTDTEGRFTLRGMGAERVVGLRVGGAGIAEEECWVVNRDGFDPKPSNEATLGNVPKGFENITLLRLLYGPEPIIVSEAEKPIRGVVTASDRGKGKAGVEVSLIPNDGDRRLPFTLKATTDASGRYDMRGVRKAKAYTLEAKDAAPADYMACQAQASDTAGFEPITADMRMAKGVIVTGRLLDRSTGKGIHGWVTAGVLKDNPFAKDYPRFNFVGTVPMRETAADGSFRLVTIPGPVLLMGGPSDREARHRYKQPVPDPNYPQYFPKTGYEGSYFGYGGGYWLMQGNSCKVLEIKPGTADVRQDIPLELATPLPLLLRDADGKPLTGVSVAGATVRDWYSPVTCETDSCTAYDVEPRKQRLLVFFEPGRKLAASLTLKGDEVKPPVVVTLRPPGVVKGRLVGPDGHPLVGVVVDLNYKDRPAQEIHKIAYQSRQIVTGPDGSFAVDTVLTGLPYDLTFKRQRKQFKLTAKPEIPFAAGSQKLKSGETLDLGDQTLEPSQ